VLKPDILYFDTPCVSQITCHLRRFFIMWPLSSPNYGGCNEIRQAMSLTGLARRDLLDREFGLALDFINDSGHSRG